MPIPVVLCGRLERVGSIVISELQPDYEGKKISHPPQQRLSHLTGLPVTYFVMSVEDGIRNLPLLLSGSTPVNDKSNLGSKNYSVPPKAIILGGGYDDGAIAQLREAVTNSPGTVKIPWLKADPDKTKAGPTPGSEEYCRAAASRIKYTLGSILERCELGSEDDEIFYW